MAIDWNSAKTWEALYQMRIRDPGHPKHGEIVKGMNRLMAGRMQGPRDDSLTLFEMRREGLIRMLDLLPMDRIVIIGGLYLVEVFEDIGFTSVVGLDPSIYVQDQMFPDSTDSFVNRDVRDPDAPAELRSRTGDDKFKWVISEDIMTGYDDNEMASVLEAAEMYLAGGEPLTNIVHIVTSVDPDGRTGDSMVNWKSLVQWKAMRPDHTWIDMNFRQKL